MMHLSNFSDIFLVAYIALVLKETLLGLTQ